MEDSRISVVFARLVDSLPRPASANLDALLVLLGLAASHPESVLLLRSEDSQNRRFLADECKTRRYRALAVTLSSTLAAMPAAALVNTRHWLLNLAGVRRVLWGIVW